nr:MAG TPA: hypothetical protein [Caudoviricetes sp.]
MPYGSLPNLTGMSCLLKMSTNIFLSPCKSYFYSI